MTADSLTGALLQQALWLQLWVGWLVLVNAGGSLLFIRRIEARWALAAFVSAAVFMEILYQQFGYQRILGLAHVVFWTPFWIYLLRRRDQWDLSRPSGKWLAILFLTNTISLVIDYIDVARYLLGERL